MQFKNVLVTTMLKGHPDDVGVLISVVVLTVYSGPPFAYFGTRTTVERFKDDTRAIDEKTITRRGVGGCRHISSENTSSRIREILFHREKQADISCHRHEIKNNNTVATSPRVFNFLCVIVLLDNAILFKLVRITYFRPIIIVSLRKQQ